jgi:hypothetical protein
MEMKVLVSFTNRKTLIPRYMDRRYDDKGA